MEVDSEIQLSNDDTRIKELFDIFYQSLCLFAYKYLRDRELAAEIVQDSFLVLWQNISHLKHQENLKSYLYTTVKNKCLDYLKKNLPKRDDNFDFQSEVFFDKSLIAVETNRILYNAIENLPEQSKKVIYFTLDGLKNQEIADKMGVSFNTVTTLKKIAFKKLRIALKDYYYLFVLLIP